jgi:hypothetical protein
MGRQRRASWPVVGRGPRRPSSKEAPITHYIQHTDSLRIRISVGPSQGFHLLSMIPLSNAGAERLCIMHMAGIGSPLAGGGSKPRAPKTQAACWCELGAECPEMPYRAEFPAELAP